MLSRLTSQVVYCNLCYLAASKLTRQAFYCYWLVRYFSTSIDIIIYNVILFVIYWCIYLFVLFNLATDMLSVLTSQVNFKLNKNKIKIIILSNCRYAAKMYFIDNITF